ncbi:MAG: hypothetical protein ACRDD1_14890, partial [Planctomycetia bacterium]
MARVPPGGWRPSKPKKGKPTPRPPADRSADPFHRDNRGPTPPAPATPPPADDELLDELDDEESQDDGFDEEGFDDDEDGVLVDLEGRPIDD